MTEPTDRIRSGKVVHEDRFLVRHRTIQFRVECLTDEDAQAILHALEMAYDAIPTKATGKQMAEPTTHPRDQITPDILADPVPMTPPAGATKREGGSVLVERAERILTILADSQSRGPHERINDATEALRSLHWRLIDAAAKGKDRP